MKDKIIDRIDDLSNKIEELCSRRDSLVDELKLIDIEVHAISRTILELKKLIDDNNNTFN